MFDFPLFLVCLPEATKRPRSHLAFRQLLPHPKILQDLPRAAGEEALANVKEQNHGKIL